MESGVEGGGLEHQLKLTPEFIAQAEKGEFSHPVLSVFRDTLPKIQELSREAGGGKVPSDKLGFLGDALVAKGSYPLEAKDLMGIWGGLVPISELGLQGGAGMAISDLITHAYMVQGAENPAWKKFPRFSREHPGEPLPDELANDTKGLMYALQRLGHVDRSLYDIHAYQFGGEENRVKVEKAFANIAVVTDDKGKQEILETVKRYGRIKQERTTPLLDKVTHNNWGYTTGMTKASPLSALEDAKGNKKS